MCQERSLEIWAYGVGMSKRVSAEARIETIIEQARAAEAGSVDRVVFLQDVSALCLVGLRQLAREIDRLHDPLEVASDIVGSSNLELPVGEPAEFAVQLAELTSQVEKMTEAFEKLSKDLKHHSNDFKKPSKRRRKK